MLPDQMINSWVSLGIGGILALVIFNFYRKDIKQYTELWRAQSEILMKVVIDNTSAMTDNANAISALKDKLNLNGNYNHAIIANEHDEVTQDKKTNGSM